MSGGAGEFWGCGLRWLVFSVWGGLLALPLFIIKTFFFWALFGCFRGFFVEVYYLICLREGGGGRGHGVR